MSALSWQGNSFATSVNGAEDIGLNSTVTLDNEIRGNFDDKYNDNIIFGIEDDTHIENDVGINTDIDLGIETDSEDDGEVVDYDIVEPEDQLPIEQIEKYIQAVTNTYDTCIDPKIMSYIDNNEYQHILFGPQENEIKPSNQTKKLPRLNAQEKRLFRFINIVFQTPACVRVAKSTWTSSKVRGVYERTIRDFLVFVIKNKIDGKDVDESNMFVDGYSVRDFMQHKIEQHQKSTCNEQALFDTLRKVRNALVALQGQIALHRSTQVRGHKMIQQVFSENANATNMEIVTNFLKERKNVHDELRKNSLDDKALSTDQFDRYSRKQVIQMSTNMWNNTGLGTANDERTHINSFLDLLVGHHLLIGGENKRSLEISDARYTIEETSRGDIPLLSFQLTHSKRIAAGGKARSMGACRCKHVEICLISVFAFSLWYRFDFEGGSLHGKKFPNFMSKENWYPIKVLFSTRGNDRKEICDTYEKKLFTNCFDSIGHNFPRISHNLRKSNAQNASAFGITEDQIARAGHLSNNAVAKHYLSPFPFDYIHFSAGFEPDEPYYIARDIDVPLELQKMIFPWLEDWIYRVDHRTDHNDKDEKEKDRQLSHFLRMLMKFRSIIIQDLAVRMEKSPNSVFAKHQITRHPAFTVFLEKMNRHMENENNNCRDPNLADYYKAVDRLCSPLSKTLKTFQTFMEYGFKKNFQEVSSMKATLDEMRPEINDKFDNMAGENVELKEKIDKLEDKIDKLEEKIAELQENNSELKEEMVESKEILYEVLTHLRSGAKSNITLQDTPKVTQTRCESTTLVKQRFFPVLTPTGVTGLKKNTAATDSYPTSETELIPRKTVIDSINDWYVSTEQTKSIKERNMIYKTQWRKTSETNSRYKRKRSVLRFLKKLKLRINDGRLNMNQLAWLSDKYKTNQNLSLYDLTERPPHDNIEGILDLWAKLSEKERVEVSSLNALDGESDNE